MISILIVGSFTTKAYMVVEGKLPFRWFVKVNALVVECKDFVKLSLRSHHIPFLLISDLILNP